MSYQDVFHYLAFSAFSVAFVYVFAMNKRTTTPPEPELSEEELELKRSNQEKLIQRRSEILTRPLTENKVDRSDVEMDEPDEPLHLVDSKDESDGYVDEQAYSEKQKPLKVSTNSDYNSEFQRRKRIARLFSDEELLETEVGYQPHDPLLTSSEYSQNTVSGKGYEEDEVNSEPILHRPRIQKNDYEASDSPLPKLNSYEDQEEFQLTKVESPRPEIRRHRRKQSSMSNKSGELGDDEISNYARVITSDSDSESLHMYNMYQDDDYRTKYLIRMNALDTDMGEIISERESDIGYYLNPTELNEIVRKGLGTDYRHNAYSSHTVTTTTTTNINNNNNNSNNSNNNLPSSLPSNGTAIPILPSIVPGVLPVIVPSLPSNITGIPVVSNNGNSHQSMISQIPVVERGNVTPVRKVSDSDQGFNYSKMEEDDDDDEEDLQSDWNVRFQNVIKSIRRFSPSTRLRERVRDYLKLLHLAKDFLYTAQMYGKIIVSEAYLPPDQKTIKPVSKPGMLGGEKYITHGILFKFAVDHKGLFGSDFAAAKVAGHELKGLISYFNCGLPELNVPLMCLVDYRGFRLIAISVLPIDDSTIIYGTCDAGKHLHASDDNFNKMMRKAATKLNVQPHRVGNQILYSPADLEGHKGKDDKYYLLDFSRVFPPEAPITSIKNAHLSRLLRPEFVMSYSSTPLCSDAFSGFIKGFHDKFNKDVVEATEWLLSTLIPKFSRGELTSLMSESRQQGILESFRLTETIHSRGINCRYLGLIRKYVEDNDFKTIILIEILARVIKNNLRLKLRLKMQMLKKPLEEPYRRMVIKFMNLIFGNSAASDQYWNEHLKMDIKRNYIMALTKEELDPSYNLKRRANGAPDEDFLLLLMTRLEKMTGMKFSYRIRSNIKLYMSALPFNETDLETLPLKVKHMNIVNIAEGFFYSLKGLTTRVEDPLSSQRFYMTAIEKFEEALDSNPNNKELLLNVALTWTLALEDEFSQELTSGGSFPKNHHAVIKSQEYYLRAISTPPRYDSHSLFLYAYFLERCGLLDAAEDYYLQSLESDPDNVACLLQYGNLLSEQGLHDDAEKFYTRASENTKGLTTMEWDYWGSPKSRELSVSSPRLSNVSRKSKTTHVNKKS